MSDYLWPHGLQHARPPWPSLSSGVCSNSWPCYLTISSSASLFSFCLQSFSASGFFQMSQLFTSSGQSIGGSASASVLPMDIQDWFPLGWTNWISLQSKGLSRVFSNTTVRYLIFIWTFLKRFQFPKPKSTLAKTFSSHSGRLFWTKHLPALVPQSHQSLWP